MKNHLSPWLPPPESFALDDDEVHVWCVPLEIPASNAQYLQQTLPVEEMERAQRFVFEEDRSGFIVARGLLRVIIARYLALDPRRLRFCYNSYGKPGLLRESEQDSLFFNMSHAKGLALYALSRNREVGIDIERIRADRTGEEIAKTVFSPRELEVFRKIPAEMKRRAFLNCWTRKEAYVKATGRGLSIPLDQLEVALAPGEPAALLRTPWDPEETNRWQLRDLAPADGFAAALAVEGQGWRLKCFRCSSQQLQRLLW